MGRHANPDIRRAFVEFQDSDTPSKCNKVRCQHCGFVRAKNTTRQIEHLQECQAYLNSPDAQAHMMPGQASQSMVDPNMSQGPSAVLSGQQPNPNLQVHRRGPNTKRARDGQPIAPNPMQQHPAPSLTNHLLATCSRPFAQATQQPFLSHAGCGSLAAGPLLQWLVQDGHYSRGYIRFVGQLLAKIRLPQTQNSQFHPMYRTMDLLISALNNMRREMQFFEITATKYGLALTLIPNWTSPAFNKFVDATRALVDELANTTTARDGKEEMQRCDEIFRQICWLEQRFWPEVDGMGEEDEGAQLGGPAHMGPMGAGLDNGMNNNSMGNNHMGNQNMGSQNMNNGPINAGRMNSNSMNNNMGSSNMNGSIGAQMNRASMSGPMMGGQGMGNQNMSGQGMGGAAMNDDDGTPGNDDGRRNTIFANSSLEGQGS
ncbi:hypothetical protein N0V87_003120 [Didymella glomerata]|uniref:Heme oxygenase-like protein n=1 Tax=Didymella glomerata TaxID=749621 RepID=A0A9W9C328_9PLEO|nr:hypothetical protein N0V87_003120 [Didymella glomerata]